MILSLPLALHSSKAGGATPFRLSTMTSRTPSVKSRLAIALPINPAPPVMAMRASRTLIHSFMDESPVAFNFFCDALLDSVGEFVLEPIHVTVQSIFEANAWSKPKRRLRKPSVCEVPHDVPRSFGRI